MSPGRGRIRPCGPGDIGAILSVVNDAAGAYRGVIPADRWHDPYMTREELASDIAAGVEFHGWEEGGVLVGVMGIQDRTDVTLIRHAYVCTDRRREGIGSRLLEHLEGLTDKPVLIGTWAAAGWAVGFYEKHGYRKVTPHEKDRLLKRYWNIPERQVATSVVLADRRWFSRGVV